jgi:zinc transport system substrate-binding protein
LAGSVAAGDATSPGAAHLKELQEAAGSTALCLFPEAGHDPKLLAQLAEATGVKLGGALDPEGVTVAPDAGAYLAVLNGVADTLLACLADG